MCRVLAYLGTPLLLDDLFYQPDNSLVRQSYAPQMLHMLNLAGFGMLAWDPDSHVPQQPFCYKSTNIPIFDNNLKMLAEKVRSNCVLAHVRGVAYTHLAQVGEQNVHPFHYKNYRIALAHNGDLAHFDQMKLELIPHIKPEIFRFISGTTDSEWIYALLLSQFHDPKERHDLSTLVDAVKSTLAIIRKVRERLQIGVSSSVNLFVSDGEHLIATRFTFDFGCYGNKVHEANLRYLSLWYTLGNNYQLSDSEWKMTGKCQDATSIILASEPLTRDVSTWIEVPEYSIMSARIQDGRCLVKTITLDV